MKTKEFQIDVTDNEILANLLGVFDKNLRVIEKALGIEIKNRGNIFLLSGSTENLIRGEKIIKDLYISAANEKRMTALIKKYKKTLENKLTIKRNKVVKDE